MTPDLDITPPGLMKAVQPRSTSPGPGDRLYDPESGQTLGDLSVQRLGQALRAAWRRVAAPSRACAGA
ncbi:hypothetical protein [Bradyrhizobium sp.]|uniref:hypothetical protein n=1 Tax=Bradyrhizobium sp. TaxID=376 RepID=UPI0025BFE161|nr:hypothetical protein [Bradyrhizobium sp.]